MLAGTNAEPAFAVRPQALEIDGRGSLGYCTALGGQSGDGEQSGNMGCQRNLREYRSGPTTSFRSSRLVCRITLFSHVPTFL